MIGTVDQVTGSWFTRLCCCCVDVVFGRLRGRLSMGHWSLVRRTPLFLGMHFQLLSGFQACANSFFQRQQFQENTSSLIASLPHQTGHAYRIVRLSGQARVYIFKTCLNCWLSTNWLIPFVSLAPTIILFTNASPQHSRTSFSTLREIDTSPKPKTIAQNPTFV